MSGRLAQASRTEGGEGATSPRPRVMLQKPQLQKFAAATGRVLEVGMQLEASSWLCLQDPVRAWRRPNHAEVFCNPLAKYVGIWLHFNQEVSSPKWTDELIGSWRRKPSAGLAPENRQENAHQQGGPILGSGPPTLPGTRTSSIPCVTSWASPGLLTMLMSLQGQKSPRTSQQGPLPKMVPLKNIVVQPNIPTKGNGSKKKSFERIDGGVLIIRNLVCGIPRRA
nr:uncharacterized protein LOC123278271 [Equus asinus]